MERRSNYRQFSKENVAPLTLQKQLMESRKPKMSENAPDLTDFMNDMFFGAINTEKKVYNLTGSVFDDDGDEEEAGFDDSTRSNSSRLTQEWLEEARRMVASSPSRCESPSRLVGSPRFGAVPSGRLLSTSTLDRRDPLSRSARRHRAVEGFSGEILAKSAKHSRNRSESLDNTIEDATPSQPSPASQVQKWFSNIIKPSNIVTIPPEPTSPQQSITGPLSPSSFDPTTPTLPPRQSTHRKSRFQTKPSATAPPATQENIPVPPRRSFKPAPSPDNYNQLLSPPKNLIESAQRRSISASTCSKPEKQQLSPPRNLVESAQRRSISRSTCSIEKIAPSKAWEKKEEEQGGGEKEVSSINGFLKDQRIKIDKILHRQVDSKAKVILSGPSKSTSSMIAAVCYAWLLENRLMKSKGEGDGEDYVVAPVMNVRRGEMWNHRQSAWLFHHIGLDAASLLFADEVDLESLIMSGKLNIIVVGQDILRTNGEVGSECTVLTDNYCEDAYDLLQTPLLRKLLLAGILSDTQNLNPTSKLAKTRDAEAVQLLLVGSAPNYRNTLYEQLMQDQRDNFFCEALQRNFGFPPAGRDLQDNETQMEQMGKERKSTSAYHQDVIIQKSNKNSNDVKDAKATRDTLKPAKAATTTAKPAAAPEGSRGKNKFFLAKWFGFGSK